VSWVKSDDRMDDTRKVKRAWRRERASIGLWYMAKTYSARHETDGLVLLEWFEDKLPDDEERANVLSVMVNEDLLEELPAGERKRVKVTRIKKGKPVEIAVTHGPVGEAAYIVHDYLEFNEARCEAEERRRSDAERKTKARDKSSGQSPAGVTAASEQPPDGLPSDAGESPQSVQTPRPDPTRPDPTYSIEDPPSPPQAGGRKRTVEEFEQRLTAWAVAEFPYLSPGEAFRYSRSALGEGLRSRDDVRGYVERWTVKPEAA
jgi:hypothetical protein